MKNILTIEKIKQLVISEIIIPANTTANVFSFRDEPRLRNEKVKKIFVCENSMIYSYQNRLLLSSFELSLCRITISNHENKKILDDIPVNFLSDFSSQYGITKNLQLFEPQTIDLSKSQLVVDNISLLNTASNRSVIFIFDFE